MQDEYVVMYGTPDQDPDNSMYTAKGVLMMEDAEGLVGLGAWGLWPDGDGKVRLLYVMPERRGAHLAETLLSALEDEMRRYGCQRARFESGPEQSPAHRLYDRHGYTRTEEGFGYYKDSPGSVFFVRDL